MRYNITFPISYKRGQYRSTSYKGTLQGAKDHAQTYINKNHLAVRTYILQEAL